MFMKRNTLQIKKTYILTFLVIKGSSIHIGRQLVNQEDLKGILNDKFFR